MGVFIRFECGRRGVNDATCRWCARLIHEVNVIVDRTARKVWRDGAGREQNDLDMVGSFEEHTHEPALEDGPTLGPFEDDFVQITYDSLRAADGEAIAYRIDDGDWMIQHPWTGAGERYSDIVIFQKTEA